MNKNTGTNFHYKKALNFIKKDNVTEAIKELKLCLKFNPKDVLALNLLGLGYYLKCRFNKAEKQWRKSLSLKKKNNQAADYLELITKNDFANLRQEYKEILFNDSAAKSKKINFLKDIIKKHDELIEPHLILGLLYKEDENYEQALKYLYQAYDLDSGNQNIKDYILEFENNQHESKLFNFKQIDLSKYKKEAAAFLIAFFAVFLIFILSNSQPLEIADKINFLNNTSQNEEVKPEKKSKELKNKNETINNNEKKPELKDSVNDFEPLNPEVNIMEYQALNNLVSFDFIREIKNKEAEENQSKNFTEYFEENKEQELFNLALQSFKSQDYKKAAVIFNELYWESEVDYLRRESLYFLARSSQLNKNYESAEKYYQLYIDNYSDTNYYAETLYNLALLLDEQSKTAEAQAVLQKLRTEKPYSSYNNSKVYEILNPDS